MVEQIGFGRWLKRLRTNQDLTQEMLAERIGCAVPTIRSFEISRRRPSREMAERIADVLKVPVEQRGEFLRLARLPIESEAAAPEDAEPVAPAEALGKPRIVVNQVAPPEMLIGRAAEINTLSHLLQHEGQRLVTILGPGGMGKTRLAQQVAATCGRSFRHGAGFVSLAAVADGQNVPTTIADSLGLDLQQAVNVPERVLQLLAEREQVVVLDNFEHLLTSTGATQSTAIGFVQNILLHCAGIRLLITSRERLRIGRERTLELGGLGVPNPGSKVKNDAALAQSVADSDAAILFVARAQAVDSGFVLDSENRAAVARICHLLDGMPLALELAASWVRVLTCEEIADEIQRSIDFLALADRDMHPRHRSMRAVFDQSWSLLSAEEQRVLRRLSVLRGGCRREAALAVAEATLPILAALIDKSLVRRSQTGTATRYDMHELIRQYAEEQLRADPNDAAATQQRHGEYYLGFLAARNETLNSSQSMEVKIELSAEIDNLRLAWEWAVSHQRGDLLNQVGWTLWIFLEMRALYREGEELFRRATQMAQQMRNAANNSQPISELTGDRASDLLWAHMVAHQASFTLRQLRPVEARNLVAPAIVLLRQANAPLLIQHALFSHGCASWFHGAFEDGVADFRESLSYTNQLQIPYLVGLHNALFGVLLYEVGDYALSFHHLNQAMIQGRKLGDPRSISYTQGFLNRTAAALGRSHETATGVEEALQLARTHEDYFCLILALEQSALLQQAQGELDKAQQKLDEAHSIALQIGEGWSRSRLLNELGHLALQKGNLTAARQHFVDAYQLARRNEFLGYAVDALAGLAELAATQQDRQRAMTLAQLVVDHKASNHATRQRARQIAAEMTPLFAADELASSQQRLQAASFDVVVTELLRL